MAKKVLRSAQNRSPLSVATLPLCNNQAPPGYGSGRYGFGVFGAQDSVLRDMCSVGTRHAFLSITFLSI